MPQQNKIEEVLEEKDVVLSEKIDKAFDEKFGIQEDEVYLVSIKINSIKSFIHTTAYKIFLEEMIEKVEPIKLDLDTIVCDCGEPYKDSDVAMNVDELLSYLNKQKENL